MCSLSIKCRVTHPRDVVGNAISDIDEKSMEDSIALGRSLANGELPAARFFDDWRCPAEPSAQKSTPVSF